MLNKILSLPKTVIVISALLLSYGIGLQFILLNHLVSSAAYLFIVQPIASLFFLALCFIFFNHERLSLRSRRQKIYVLANIMILWAIAYVLSGLVVGYVHNPLVATPEIILKNVWATIVPLVAFEYVRYVLIAHAGRRNLWYLVVIALLFAGLQLPPSLWVGVSTPLESIKLFVGSVLPILMQSVIMTYLAFTTGYKSMLIYGLSLQLLTFLPILPKYDWFLTGISSVIIAAIVYFGIDQQRQDKQIRRRHRRVVTYSRVVSISLFAIFIAFVSGWLHYRPLVIMSDSMVPHFQKGDVVIVRQKTSKMDITIGDIVQYDTSTKIVTHRVVAITKNVKTGARTYTTKGDNNNGNDPFPVSENQIKGVIVAEVPYIGRPTVALHETVLKGQ